MITENYEKMCEQAEEIQKACRFKMGDWFIHEDHHEVLIESFDSWHTINLYKKDGAIWLPTQEQLQEMVKDWLFYITGSFTDIYASASTGTRDSHVVCNKAKSMNELWLIFVMKEKYNKVWDGNKWAERNKDL